MEDLQGWLKVGVAWLASGVGYLTQHLTIGAIVLCLTGVLTGLQIWKTWLDIAERRDRLARRHHDH